VTQSIRMRAVAFQEGDAWVIQGIEYDIVAHAFDVKKLADAFSRAVTENIVITQHLGKKPLEGIKAAPDHFRLMFESAEVELRSIKKTDGPEIDVRLAA
jgi:hypothetical protein